MDLTRRRFMVLAAAAAAAGCARAWAGDQPDAGAHLVDAGPVSTFQADGVYDQFREQGFFVIRRDTQLFALSSVCTHKGCKVNAQDDLSFFCRCHGSRFDPSGHVTKGPAKRDLPRLETTQNPDGHVLVRVQ